MEIREDSKILKTRPPWNWLINTTLMNIKTSFAQKSLNKMLIIM